MPFSINVNDQVKATAREKARKRIEKDTYRLCLTIGLNPDNIIFEDGLILWQPNVSENNPLRHLELILRKFFDSYEKVL